MKRLGETLALQSGGLSGRPGLRIGGRLAGEQRITEEGEEGAGQKARVSIKHGAECLACPGRALRPVAGSEPGLGPGGRGGSDWEVDQ